MNTRQIQRIYYLIQGLFWLSVSLPMALGVLLMQARGLDLLQVGALMGAFSLTIVLLEAPTGGLADAVGRKRVTVIAYVIMWFSSALVLFAFSFPVYLLAFVVSGVGRALSSGALDAWFVDALQTADPEVELQPALARAGSVALLALGGGTLLGSALPGLFSFLPQDGTAVLTPLSVPIVVALVISVVEIALTIWLVREERPSSADAGLWAGFRQTPAMVGDAVALSRRNPTILLLMGATLASGLAIISLESFWQPHFASLLNYLPGGGANGQTLLFGVIMGGNFLMGTVGNLLSTPVSRWLNGRYGLAAALFQGLRGALMIALALATGVPVAVALFWLVYLNMGGGNSPHAALMNRQIPAARRSSMLSLESLVGYVGSAVGSVALGYVAERGSIGTTWIIGGSILMVSLFLYLQVDRRERQERHVIEAAILETS